MSDGIDDTLTRAISAPLKFLPASHDAARRAWHWRTALAALLVASGYYAGSQVGLTFRLPPGTPSPLWPPNAILTAALLTAHPRRWSVYLLAALPAHLLAQWGAPWPLTMVCGLYVTNCSEALLGAWAVRRLSDAPERLDTQRRIVALLLGAVLIGPFASTFLDAAVVTGFDGQTYWDVWWRRFASNVLTELALVPAILTIARQAHDPPGAMPWRRRAEVGLFTLALVSVSLAGVMAGGADGESAPYVERAALTTLLPLVAWAVVRFGPGGTSLSVLTAAFVVMWSATHTSDLVGRLTRQQSVPVLQIFLTVTFTPMLCVAALIEERRVTAAALGMRLRFEELLSALSRVFVQPSSDEMDAAFETSLQGLGYFFGADAAVLLRPSADGDGLAVAYAWSGAGATSMAVPAPGSECPGFNTAAAARDWSFASRDELAPEDARLERSSLVARGAAAAAGVPLLAAGRISGAVVLLSARPRSWPPELFRRLTVATEVLAHALARKHYEEALRASETINGAILSSLSSCVAVLDRHGRVISLNESWAAAIHGNDPQGPRPWSLIEDYVEVCRRSRHPCTAEDVTGIDAVLEGTGKAFTVERSYQAPDGERWYAVSVVPLNRPEGGAVVSHTDVTGRRHAESQARQSREELAHLLRVSTMGELTTAIAHELNQPLTSILANAQTARHLLAAEEPDLDELRAIVTDMIDEDMRAGEVIRRLRELLSKGQRESAVLDLNTLVDGVGRMIASDALIRGVALRLEPAPQPLLVGADGVQIQQVLLNLALNAMEAMEGTDAERVLTIRSGLRGTGVAEVAVTDTGKGIQQSPIGTIFQPFYTTKASGMGMGLYIARSIAQAHGGGLDAVNNSAGGATFILSLPLALGTPSAAGVEPAATASARHPKVRSRGRS